MRRNPILPRRILIRSALSGAAWAGVAVALLWLVSGEPVTTLAWKFRGGIAAGPFIGIAAGVSWRMFLRARLGGRLALALLTLYGAVFLFFAAAGLTNLASGVPGSVSVSDVLRESVVSVILGLRARLRPRAPAGGVREPHVDRARWRARADSLTSRCERVERRGQLERLT